jgi:predicted AAA+ superfamily ATPase
MHSQLAALTDLAEDPTELHFYRTHTQVEVDFVLSRPRALVGIELKHGATVTTKDASGLESFRQQFDKEVRFGLVLYLGRTVIPLSAHVIAVPLASFFGG